MPKALAIILHFRLAYDHPFVDGNDLTHFLIYHLEVIRRALEQLNDFVRRKTEELDGPGLQLRVMRVLNRRRQALIAHALRLPRWEYTIESHRMSHNIVYQTARSDLLDLINRRLPTSREVERFC